MYVSAISVGHYYRVGNMIYHAVRQVAQKDVVTMEKGQSTLYTLQRTVQIFTRNACSNCGRELSIQFWGH